MYNLSLNQLFGKGATQDDEYLVIQKSDLPGLTPNANNTAESLLAGIIIKALENFEGTIIDENNNYITDEDNNPITYKNTKLFEDLEIFLWGSYPESRDLGSVKRTEIIIHHYYTYDPD